MIRKMGNLLMLSFLVCIFAVMPVHATTVDESINDTDTTYDCAEQKEDTDSNIITKIGSPSVDYGTEDVADETTQDDVVVEINDEEAPKSDIVDSTQQPQTGDMYGAGIIIALVLVSITGVLGYVIYKSKENLV